MGASAPQSGETPWSQVPASCSNVDVPPFTAPKGRLRALHDGLDELLAQRRTGLDRLVAQLGRRAPDVAPYRLRVDDFLRTARRQLGELLALRRERLNGISRRLEALDPRAVLQRGYAIVQRRDTGAVVTRAAQVAAGDDVDVTVAEGAFGAWVE